MKEERLKQMEEYLKQNEMCRLDVLCDMFGISKITARRDIDELCKTGAAEKIYGGVRFPKKDALPTVPYSRRHGSNADKKDYIGRLAASIVCGGDTVFIDSGTTTLHLIKYVPDKKINVVTHNLNAVEECLNHENINVFVLGGEFDRLTNSFTGENTTHSMGLYNISKAFLAATGASLTQGFTNSAPAETNIKKKAVDRCPERYVMIDSSKWNVVSLKTFADTADITGVITDSKPPDGFVKLFGETGVQLIY